MKRVISLLVLLVLLFGFSKVNAGSGPQLSVDAEEFDMGSVNQVSTTTLKHVFKIKNIGDSVLVIRDVKPG